MITSISVLIIKDLLRFRRGIFTATPEGVINDYPSDKQVRLKPGDRLTTTIEKLGEMRFSVV